MNIIFVRHGKDDDNYRGGWSNLDLTPDGILQAENLAKHLSENKNYYNISHIVTSDLQRALTTAEIIANELNIPVLKDEKLREITELTRPMLLEWVDEILVSENERIQVNLKFQDSYEQIVEYVNPNTKADIPA